MKIAINCIYFTPKGGGITEYIYNLVKEILLVNENHNFIIYITKDVEKEIRNIAKDLATIKIFPFTENQKIKRSLFQQKFWSKEEQIEKFDLFHSPFFHSPRFKNAKTILTVHDLRFLNYPNSYKFLRLVYLKYAVKNSIKRADHIIAISNFTKHELIKYYQVRETKVNVIHEAVNKEGFTLKNKKKSLSINNFLIENNKYILAVGHLEPRKNYLNLIKAYAKLPNELQTEYCLIIVGKKNHDYEAILNLIKNTKNVIYLNFITRDELTWLYANCKAHIFPSFYEGFGFPSLEAGMFGKPTIGANQSSIPEITGKGGIYFDPFSIEDIAEKTQKLLSENDLYETLSKDALENTYKFSWVENAKETMNIYNQLEK